MFSLQYSSRVLPVTRMRASPAQSIPGPYMYFEPGCSGRLVNEIASDPGESTNLVYHDRDKQAFLQSRENINSVRCQARMNEVVPADEH